MAYFGKRISFPILLSMAFLISNVPIEAENTPPQESSKKFSITKQINSKLFSPLPTDPNCKQPYSEDEIKELETIKFNRQLLLSDIWANSSKDKDNGPVIKLVTDKLGNFVTIDIIHSSGNSDFEQAAINNIKKKLPFKPLPSFHKEGETFLLTLSPTISKFYQKYPTPEAAKEANESYYGQNGGLVQKVAATIKKNWRPPLNNSNFSKHASVLIWIYAKTGEIIETRIETTSCDLAYDQSLLKAVHATKKLDPINRSLTDVVTISMLMDMDVSRGNTR